MSPVNLQTGTPKCGGVGCCILARPPPPGRADNPCNGDIETPLPRCVCRFLLEPPPPRAQKNKLVQTYELAVKELKPSNAVGIVETDLNVDFDAPVGYDESLAASKAAAAAAAGSGGGGSSGATGAIGGGAINIPAPASGVEEWGGGVPFLLMLVLSVSFLLRQRWDARDCFCGMLCVSCFPQ